MSVATIVKFTESCQFTRGDDGKVGITWDNGHAVNAVRGAAIDYIDPKYHVAATESSNILSYAPAQDLANLIKADVPPVLALVIVGMRKVVTSFNGCELNIAEVKIANTADDAGSIPEKEWGVIVTNQAAFNSLLDIAPTILGMNGLSLMLKGHNYLDSDSMWARLEASADIDSLVGPLGIVDYAGVLFHDALHPFSAEWKVSLASKVNSPLIGHVNGVLVKRLPGVPAGTALISVTLAAIGEIQLARPAAGKSLKNMRSVLAALQRKIRAAPLNWCAAFQRSMTAENLAHVSRLEPLCAFIYGVCSKIFDRKMSIMKSQSFKNNASRHTAMTSRGATWGEALPDEDVDETALAMMFADMLTDVKDNADLDSDDDDEDDDDEEPAQPASPAK